MRRLRAVTFNVLIGSPFPSPFVGRFAANLGSAAGALRLQQQTQHVADAAADIVCLQELHDCRVTRGYSAAFAASHVLVAGSHFNARGECAAPRALSAPLHCARARLARGRLSPAPLTQTPLARILRFSPGCATFILASLALGAALYCGMVGLGGALSALPALQLPASLSLPTLPHLSLMLMQPLSPLLQPLPSVAPMLCVELPAPGSGLGGAGARLAAAAAALACVALASSALLSSELVVVSFLLGRTHGS